MPRRRRDEPVTLPSSVANVVDSEDIYPIINYVQIAREQVSFIASNEDSIIMENILKDSEIPFTRKELVNGVKYNLEVPPQREIPDERFIFDEEEYPDELIEEGQCF